MRHSLVTPFLIALAATTLPAQEWAGQWYTTEGVAHLEAADGKITGTYGRDGANQLDGKAKGRKLTFTFKAGRVRGKGTFELEKGGHFFTGEWSNSAGGRGEWTGWREDPAATKGRAGKFGGAWRTSWGILQLTQKGKKVSGSLGAQGWYKVRGEVQGRRLQLTHDSFFGTGEIWAELRPDGAAAFGAASSRGSESKWIARRLEGFRKNVVPVPGKIVQGLAGNGMTYYVRAPKGWTKRKRVPAIVFFHGSNMSVKPYVLSLASRKELADRFLIVGIDGERWVDSSRPDDPRHNYTYVNWMGKSTYKGYPHTDRESPALVAEVIEELRKRWEPTKVFAGGHSQGGYLSYFLIMHFPELVDGVFPMSCGLVIQCEPDVFDKEELRAAQRRTPLAIVHGERDPTVGFSMGLTAFRAFQEQGFPRVRLFKKPVGHMFLNLPFAEAIAWLTKMSADDEDELLAFAEASFEKKRYGDVMAVVGKLREGKLAGVHKTRTAALAARVDQRCQAGAAKYAKAIAKNKDGSWVDGYLEFRDDFALADAARPAVAAFAKLRATHEEPAKKLLGEARGLFRSGKRNEGWSKYEEIVKKWYASSLYRRVKGWLANRK